MFLRYAREKSRGDTDDELYRTYVTDCLKGLCGARVRFAEWARPAPDFDVDEVIDDVISRAGLEVT